MNILFVTWDGPQVSYLESLFLPIFCRLKEYGYCFHVMQFSWASEDVIKSRRLACESTGVNYSHVSVIRTPVAPGALLTAVLGSLRIKKYIKDHHIDVLMPRSTLPALSTLLAMRGRSEKIIFDADGLPLDERVDFDGLPSSGFSYRFLRDVEAQAVRKADVVITRADFASDILLARAGAGTSRGKFKVVKNGRDANVFNLCSVDSSAKVRGELSIFNDAPLVIYAGSLGGKYKITEVYEFFTLLLARRPDSYLLILTASEAIARAELVKFPDLKGRVIVKQAEPIDVARYLSASDLGLAFIEPKFSMKAVSAIKIGEYLLCGIPVAVSNGVGSDGDILKPVSYALNNFGKDSLSSCVDWFCEVVLTDREKYRNLCREIGLNNFSLDSTLDGYLSALRSIHE